MIIDDFDIRRSSGGPSKANAELIIHSDAVLACAVAFQHFKVVARRHTEVLQLAGNLQLPQLPPRDRSNIHPPADARTLRQRFSVGVFE